MTVYADRIVNFFVTNMPSVRALTLGGPIALFWATACLLGAGALKRHYGWKTGYTRKTFHFLIFGTVVIVNGLWETPGVCLFGGMASLVIAYAVLRGPGHHMYEALAREKDEPRRTHYIIVPYLATLIGGLLSNILFPATAVFGYLVTGLGDAVAEPVGTRFGKRLYRVPAMRGVSAIRSLEGSSSVFIVSTLALLGYLAIASDFALSGRNAFMILLIGLISTVVEAVSPHGWDNTTLQIIPAWFAAVLIVGT